MKRIMYAMAAILLLGLGACKSKQTITPIPVVTEVESVEVVTEVEPIEFVTEVEPVEVEEVEAEEETRAEHFELVDTDAEVHPTDYFVVVGSFKSFSNAQGLQTTLRQEGVLAVLAINEQQMYRVIYASFDNYEKARVQRDALKVRFADAWILVQK